MGRKKQKYPFTRDMEILVTLTEITSKLFHDSIGHAIDPDRMPSDDCKTIIVIAHNLAKRLGSACTNTTYFLQELKVLNSDGRIDQEELLSCYDLLLDADTHEVNDLDSLIAIVVPVVKRIKHKDILEKALKDYTSGVSLDTIADQFNKLTNLGRKKKSEGSFLLGQPEEFDQLLDVDKGKPLPTSVDEIDIEIDGGLEPRALGVVMAGSGDGKSYMLCSIAAKAITEGLNVLYLTLELSEHEVKSRIYRNILNMTEDQMRADRNECALRFNKAVNNGIGTLRVQYESPGITTPGHVREILANMEKDHGLKISVIVVDYADKLVSSLGSKKRKYDDMELVYDALRDLAVERDGWIWTASQTTRSASRTEFIDQKDVADSLHKVRSADLIIAVARTKEDVENGLVRFTFPKRRAGPAPTLVGPLCTAWERGKMADSYRMDSWHDDYTAPRASHSAAKLIDKMKGPEDDENRSRESNGVSDGKDDGTVGGSHECPSGGGLQNGI